MGQLSALHVDKCSATESTYASRKSDIDGAIGFEPLVFMVRISEASPTPILNL